MSKKCRNNKAGQEVQAFTIIEVLIVLAIAGLIMVIVFLAEPKLLRDHRNFTRKNFAQQIYAGILEYKSNNNLSPGCDSVGGISCSATANQVRAFFAQDMPSGVYTYDFSGLVDSGGGLHTADNSLLYIYDSHFVDHSTKPTTDQVIIEVGHWCYSTKPDNGLTTNPVASDSLSLVDNNVDKFAILIGTEPNSYYCVDNYY